MMSVLYVSLCVIMIIVLNYIGLKLVITESNLLYSPYMQCTQWLTLINHHCMYALKMTIIRWPDKTAPYAIACNTTAICAEVCEGKNNKKCTPHTQWWLYIVMTILQWYLTIKGYSTAADRCNGIQVFLRSFFTVAAEKTKSERVSRQNRCRMCPYSRR